MSDSSGRVGEHEALTDFGIADDGMAHEDPIVGDGSYRLRYALEKGKSYNLMINQDQWTWISLPGMNLKFSQIMILDNSFDVQAVSSKGKFGINRAVNRVRYTETGLPSGDQVYDTDNKEGVTPPLSAAMHESMIGKPLLFVWNTNGSVDTVKGSNEAVLTVVEKMQEGAAKEVMRKQVVALFGNSYMKGATEWVAAIYPNEPKKVGDTWSRSVNRVSGLSMALDLNYELSSVENNEIAIINVTGQVGPGNQESAIGAGFSGTLDVEGAINGTIKVDLQSGWIIDSNVSVRAKGKVIVDKDGHFIDMKITYTAKGELP